MDIKYEWRGGKEAEGENTVYWELPDVSKAIEISMTPAIVFMECERVYQTVNVVKEIENQLFLVDTKKIGSSISFKKLLELPRLLKRNYFDSSS